jgi:hypothetical protein
MGMGMGMGMGGMGMGMGMGLGMGMGIGIGMGPSGPGGRYASPGPSDPSVFQVEAAKKLLLVQLILHGKVRGRAYVHEKQRRDDAWKTLPLPKYTHPTVANLKGTPYNTLARAYPILEQVHTIAAKERSAFVAVRDVLLWRKMYTDGVNSLHRTTTTAYSG